MNKKIIKKYSTLNWVEKGNTFIKKSSVESINDEYMSVRTRSGMDYRFDTKKEFEIFIKQFGFNEPGE